MIYGLRGIISYKGINNIEVDVNGVFYGVMVAKKVLETLVLDQEITIRTYMHVTEDSQSLFGFITSEEVELFKMLISVSGVGPKSAMLIFDQNEVDKIKRAVMEADVDFFKKVKGLGLKTAQKIIIELKTKIGSLKDLDLNASETILNQDEVYLSLIQLGFDRKSVVEVMKKLPKDLKTIEERLEWCLKSM